MADGYSFSIYAINGDTGNTVNITPGDNVTYRMHYFIPTGDYENLSMKAYLPLPIFSVTDYPDLGWNNPGDGITLLNPGQYSFLNNDNAGNLAGFHPAITGDVTANTINFSFGTRDDANNLPLTVDLLFTVQVRNNPFADGLNLTTLEQKTSNNTQVVSSKPGNRWPVSRGAKACDHQGRRRRRRQRRDYLYLCLFTGHTYNHQGCGRY